MKTPAQISILAAQLADFKTFTCSCKQCRGLCENVSCMGTPADIKALIDAGHKDDLMPTVHWGALEHGLPPLECVMIKARETGTGCSLFVDGKCTLHDKGLKPSEGKFANHNPKEFSFPSIAATWLIEENAELVKWIFAQFPPLEPIDPEEVEFMTEIASKVIDLTSKGFPPRQVHEAAVNAVHEWQAHRNLAAVIGELFGGDLFGSGLVSVGVVMEERKPQEAIV